MMQNLLQNLISTGNPQLISKYVEKYLPKDQQNLQRIYNQLSNYSPPIKIDEKQPILIQQIKPQTKKRINQTSIQQSIRKTKSLIMMLRQKGINPISQNFEDGNKIVQRQKQKFMKPLKTNPIALFLKKGQINNLCKKYDLNKQFYQNPPDGFNIGSFGYDPEMAQFIEKRKRLLKSIYEKKTNELQWDKKTKKYESVQSKIKQTYTRPKQLPSLFKTSSNKTITKQQIKTQAKHIMERCNSFHKIKNGGQDVNNVFLQLQNKILLQDQIDIDSALRTKANEKSLANQKLERYNLAYMNYLKQKQDYRSMSINRKDLLKNQIKMRGLVNFP